MKKIVTLFIAAVLVSAAAFAQDGRHRYNNNSYDNSWQQQYPTDNGYAYSSPYSHGEIYGTTGKYLSRREWRKRQAYLEMIRRQQRLNEMRYYNNYGRNRSGVSLQITLGGHRPLY
jgi:hypothetical protein